MGLFSKLTGHKNDTKYILEKVQQSKSSQEDLGIINSLLDGPKFMVFFDKADDVTRFISKITYYNREGTPTYARPISDGFYLFTGGKISGNEALTVCPFVCIS